MSLHSSSDQNGSHESINRVQGKGNVLIWLKPKRPHSGSETGCGHLPQKQRYVWYVWLERWDEVNSEAENPSLYEKEGGNKLKWPPQS